MENYRRLHNVPRPEILDDEEIEARYAEYNPNLQEALLRQRGRAICGVTVIASLVVVGLVVYWLAK